MTDFYSRNDVNYNGDVYSIPFPYIKEKEVQVFLDDTLFEDWFFLNDSQIKLRNIPQEVTSNTIVSVRRITDIDKKVVTYTNNTLLNKENLNLSQDQLLFAVQEIYDNNVQFQSDIREEVDEKVERVSDAVEKLEFLEDSVAIANEAALEATEQAQIATEKAEETLQTYETAMNDIDNLLADCIDDLNSLDATIKKDADAIINRVGLNMFDTVFKDHILTYEESKGLALQGTYVYKNAIAGSRYGYADFYNKVVEEYNEATETETVNGVSVKVHSNGHKFYNIADKTGVDDFFNTMGTAWFYGVDTTEERVFLPRNNFFDQATGDISEVGQSVGAGLPNITGNANFGTGNTGARQSQLRSANGAFKSATTAQYAAAQGSSLSGVYENLQFNASLSNPIYGNSNTVQPNAVKKLLYICVGNTVSDTSWVDVVTQVKGGVKDLEDKKNTSIAEIDTNAKSYDTLTKRQITNCLLEVPQRIKYTLENGTLTIKAGSVVIVPYGVEDLTSQYPKGARFLHDNFKVYDTQFEDGKFFVWAELVNDIIINPSSQASASRHYTLVMENGLGWIGEKTYSGTATTAETTYSQYYNTKTNYVNSSTSTTTIITSNNTQCFPFMIAQGSTSEGTKCVDQVFNGMGYIGSHKWLDKGVKLLCSNGRNEDGTLNNLEIVTEKLSLYTGGTANVRYNAFYDVGLGYVARISQIKNTFVVNSLSELDDKAGAYVVAYVIPENKFYVHASNEPWEHFIGVQVSYHTNTNSDGTVSEFTPYTPFRAVDYNDFNDLSNDVVTLQNGVGSANAYLIETYSSGTSWYRIWSNGWCEQGGQTSSTAGSTARTVTLLKAYTNANYSLTLTGMSGGSSGNPHFNVFQCTSISAKNFTALAECSEKLILRWSAAWWKA